MFKKKYLAVAGLMALAVVISGCGKKNSGDSVVQATPTPTQETAVTATPTPELINMEEADGREDFHGIEGHDCK